MAAATPPDLDIAHRVDRVTNISSASDAFVLFTLFTLFFTLACVAIWMWVIWRKGQKRRAEDHIDAVLEQIAAQPVARLSDDSGTEEESPGAPWEKPADWWKERSR